jgi:hypothetical protein
MTKGIAPGVRKRSAVYRYTAMQKGRPLQSGETDVVGVIERECLCATRTPWLECLRAVKAAIMVDWFLALRG